MKIELLDHNQTPVGGSTYWVAASADPGDIATGRPRGLLCQTSGTITVEDSEGTEIADFPVTAGQVYALGPTRITAITDAAVYLLY